MLKYLYDQSPNEWIAQNDKLANFYLSQVNQVSDDTDNKTGSENEISAIYHKFLAGKKDSIKDLYCNLIEKIDDKEYCKSLNRVITESREVFNNDQLLKVGEKI